jgi:hypothetical protein
MAPLEVISHWHHSLEGFNTSALEFYKSVEQALKAKEVPGISVKRINWQEGGFLSAKREYLRVSYLRFSFDVCAAPFGRDFFFSWWLAKETEGAVATIPVIGPVFARLFKPPTYFAIDTQILFEEAVHRTVVNIIGGLMTASKMEPLSLEERTPKRGSAL